MGSTPEQLIRSVKNRLDAIRLALEENEVLQCFDELKRAQKDLDYAIRLLNEHRDIRRT